MRTARLRTRVQPSLTLIGACAAALILPACAKQTPVTPADDVANSTGANATRGTELNWARDALKRNPTIEVVATDTSAGVFTIRSKDTGEIRAVKASELAAVPVSSLTAPMRTAAAATPETQSPASPPQDEAAARPAVAESATSTASTTSPAASRMAGSMPNYTIERTDGQLKVSGPGVSIVSAGGTSVTASENASGQRTIEPIICEGRRMLHFDNRNIYVEGDAIVARGGCELYITNSRVIASGTGVVIGDASVHIANSTVEGSAASFDARNGSQVYLRSSTFQGVPRRAEGSVVQDQGGNQWR
jgi:hypothetical protein